MKKGIFVLVLALALAVPVLARDMGLEYSETCRFYGFPIFGRDYAHTGFSTDVQGLDVGVASHISQGNDLDTWDTVVNYDWSDIISTGGGYLVLPGGREISTVTGTINLPANLRYTIAHVEQGGLRNGQLHVLGMDFDFGDDPNEISANIMMECTYNDGVNPFGDKVIRGVTHATAGFTLSLPMGDVNLLPGVYWQHTFDEAVNPERNEVWYGIGIEYRF